MMAIDMTQQGMSEHDINTEISQKFKSTMSIVEKQVICLFHEFISRLVRAMEYHGNNMSIVLIIGK